MNTIEFHKSIGQELLAMKDRVRNLVPHWGEDGRYKEAILKSVIRRFLPERYAISAGFVVRQTIDRAEHESSTQIDLIIYDTDYPVLFKEGDIVVVTPDSVRAIIEVKTNLENLPLMETVEKANRNGQFIFDGRHDKKNMLFNGIFSFEGYDNLRMDRIQNHIVDGGGESGGHASQALFKVNHISVNKDVFYKFWNDQDLQAPNFVYAVEDLSFSFFIGNLMDCVIRDSVIKNSNLWFPVDKSFTVVSEF